MNRSSDSILSMTTADRERFRSKVSQPTEPGGCALWAAYVDPKWGYGRFGIRGVTSSAHRVAWFLAHGSLPPDGTVLDHACSTPQCVSVDHLRVVTTKQNNEHLRGPNSRSKSGVRGVHWHRQTNRWQAQLSHHGRSIHVGYFDTISEAEDAVRAARAEIHTHSEVAP